MKHKRLDAFKKKIKDELTEEFFIRMAKYKKETNCGEGEAFDFVKEFYWHMGMGYLKVSTELLKMNVGTNEK